MCRRQHWQDLTGPCTLAVSLLLQWCAARVAAPIAWNRTRAPLGQYHAAVHRQARVAVCQAQGHVGALLVKKQYVRRP